MPSIMRHETHPDTDHPVSALIVVCDLRRGRTGLSPSLPLDLFPFGLARQAVTALRGAAIEPMQILLRLLPRHIHHRAAITAVARCAPPGNRPTAGELRAREKAEEAEALASGWKEALETFQHAGAVGASPEVFLEDRSSVRVQLIVEVGRDPSPRPETPHLIPPYDETGEEE